MYPSMCESSTLEWSSEKEMKRCVLFKSRDQLSPFKSYQLRLQNYTKWHKTSSSAVFGKFASVRNTYRAEYWDICSFLCSPLCSPLQRYNSQNRKAKTLKEKQQKKETLCEYNKTKWSKSACGEWWRLCVSKLLHWIPLGTVCHHLPCVGETLLPGSPEAWGNNALMETVI